MLQSCNKELNKLYIYIYIYKIIKQPTPSIGFQANEVESCAQMDIVFSSSLPHIAASASLVLADLW
jgi:hypothetical protein